MQITSMSGMVKRLFEIGESRKSDEFINFFTEDATYQFGNAAPVIGREAIRDSVANFFPLVKSFYHDIKGTYELGALLLVEMDVIYTRHDGKVVSIPVADTFRFEGSLIKGLQIYADTSPVFA